jgi:hypothetical protein
MRKTVILSIVLSLAAPALARANPHRHSDSAAVSRTDGAGQPSRWRDEVPWAPF